MDEKPGIVRFTPRSTSKSAMLIAVAVAVGVQVALCAVLVAIHFQELWLPAVQNGEVEMEFVPPSEEVLQVSRGIMYQNPELGFAEKAGRFAQSIREALGY